MEALLADIHALTGVSVRYREKVSQRERKPGCLIVPLAVGSVSVGYLVSEGELERARRLALRRVLETAFRDIAHRLQHPATSPSPEVLPGSVGRAARMLRENRHEEVSLGEVAARVNLSRERLSRLFHESLGVTFSDYLNLVRLERSRKLLRETEEKIADVAFASGYQSVSQFNRRFKEAEGLTPREFRRRERGDVAAYNGGRRGS